MRQAADAHQRLLLKTMSNVGEHAVARTWWVAPADRVGQAKELAGKLGWNVSAQAEGDLGARMCAAVRMNWLEHPEQPTIVIGSDCPSLNDSLVENAAASCEVHDVVFVPTEDGGYALVAIKPQREDLLDVMFGNMTWSHEKVLETSIERLRSVGADVGVLSTLWDVDDVLGWQRYLKMHEES